MNQEYKGFIGVQDIPIKKSEQDSEGLKVGDYAEALAAFISRTETPMTIGIQGDWGSGKTSLMNLIHSELQDKFPTVEVNTWKYAQTEGEHYRFVNDLGGCC